MRLQGKLAIITAAASGMGRAGVELFSREGATVCAIDVNAEALASMAADMAAKGTPIQTVQADLSTVDGAKGSIHAAADKLGGVDILWAHAGIPGPGGIEDLDIDAYRKAMALNSGSVSVEMVNPGLPARTVATTRVPISHTTAAAADSAG